MIDYTDKETIKNILRRYKRIEEESKRGNYEAMELIIDIEKAVGSIEFTSQEYLILMEVRKGKHQKEIEEDTGIAQGNISRGLNNVIGKICNYFTLK